MNVEQWLGEDNKLGIDIWEKKYRQNNESFDEWLDRVSGKNENIKQLIKEKKFLFGGRILSNRGLYKDDKKVTYSNCYVLSPPEDNIESIFECASKLARTFSYGGGCGIDISKLSPRGAKVNNTAKHTTGAVSFMELYNLVTGLIGQNGRRGALMLSVSCDHPDLEEFISIKNDLNNITKANISVRITDEFMNAVINKRDHKLSFIREETGEEIVKDVYAPDIFHKLCENNWNYGEPGMLFWNAIEDYNLLANDDDFEYAGVNPCAEEPLPAGGSCLLGSINLAEFVKDGEFNMDDFLDTVSSAVIALNKVLDEGIELHPLSEQQLSVSYLRQIGLGVFGVADMLIKMEIEYGSDESLYLCDDIGVRMFNEAIKTSALLAEKLGSYSAYKEDILDDNFFYSKNIFDGVRELVKKHGLRNSQLLTIAPTGSLSTMIGVSGGIEPIFDTHYTRKTESLHGEDKYYTVYTPIVKEYLDNIEEIGIDSDGKYILPEYFITAKQIDPKKRIRMQSIWQDHIDASISSTINLPEDASVTDVEDLYIYAWRSGLKGLTIFRENCARIGVLTTNKKDKLVEEKKNKYKGVNIGDGRRKQLNSLTPITREQLGDRLSGSTYVKEVACGKLYITINRDSNDNLVEVFIDPGKSGGCAANAESLGRYASACMRCGMSIDSIIDITKGVKCSACTKIKGSKAKEIDGMSCGDVLARTIQEEYDLFHSNKIYTGECALCNNNCSNNLDIAKSICPECGEPLANEGGCVICKNCGYSKCD